MGLECRARSQNFTPSGINRRGRVDLWAGAAGVAVRAVDLRQVANIDRVLEGGWSWGGAGRTFRFRHQRMALIAVPADDAAIRGDVLSVMAAEAAGVIVVAEIVGMGLPVQLHFGEGRSAENLLNLRDRIAQLELF